MATPKIIVGVDGSVGSQRALTWALAHAERTGATVDAVHAWEYPYALVMPSPVGAAVPSEEEMNEACVELLAKTVAAIGVPAGVEVNQRVVRGHAAEVMCAAEREGDVVVVGTRGRNAIAQVLLGSVSRRVATHVTTPTVVVPERGPLSAPRRVVVGVDGSPASAAALEWAAGLAPDELVVVHAWAIPAMTANELSAMRAFDWARVAESTVEKMIGELGDIDDIEVHAVIENGDARHVLLDEDLEPDLLVVGTRGHAGIVGAVSGSVTTHAVAHSSVPVAVVPPATEG